MEFWTFVYADQQNVDVLSTFGDVNTAVWTLSKSLAAGRAQDSPWTGEVRRPETDVLPLCHATNLLAILHLSFYGVKIYYTAPNSVLSHRIYENLVVYSDWRSGL